MTGNKTLRDNSKPTILFKYMNEEMFPIELLNRSNEDRLQYFDSYTVAHPSLEKAYKKLHRMVKNAKPGSLIFTFGPCGVGKTTLLRKLEKELTLEILPELHVDRGRIPVVYLLASNPLSGSFEWKEFFQQFLDELNDPLPEYKTDYTKWSDNYEGELSASDKYLSGGQYRRAVEKALKYRNPKAILIDDSHHFAKVGSGRKMFDHIDIIKSLAEKTKKVFVLAGTYELLPLFNLSGQLSRRSIEIHFERYKLKKLREIEAFQNTIWMFQNHLPLANTPDLISKFDYIYERSLGCIGIVKDWLNRALGIALDEGKERLSIRHLKQCSLNIVQCRRIHEEIIAGEKKLSETGSQRTELRELLGLEAKNKLTSSESTNLFNKDNPAMNQSSNQKRRVGERSAKRDAIQPT
jgi:hypothetical protein